MRRIRLACLFVILPLIIGGLIYITLRSTDLTMFRWFENLGFENAIIYLRNQIDWKNLPDWVKYNLPDLAWVFSFTSALYLVLKKNPSILSLVGLTIPLLLGIISELGQLIQIVPGTFDPLDLAFYFGGAILPVLSLSILEKPTPTNTNRPLAKSIIMIFFVFIAFGSNDDSEPSEIGINLAYNYAQGSVQKELNFPYHSEFPDEYELTEHIIELGAGEFLIDSWVDSISDNGDIIRRNFSCKVILVEKDAIVENLVIQ